MSYDPRNEAEDVADSIMLRRVKPPAVVVTQFGRPGDLPLAGQPGQLPTPPLTMDALLGPRGGRP
jgi:hypothetical protein